ncbi:cytochrome P450 [Paxillus ammoniavirescens]|nr:cytochrome P450 [Paxillus ammoniavirescens]
MLHVGLLFFAALAFVVGVSIHSRSRKWLPLPPGPSLLSIIRDVDVVQPWLSFTAWASTYGEVFHFSFLNQNIVVLNTEDAARALLEQRSSNYSDRPLGARILDLHGVNFSVACVPYGGEWKRHRKVFHHAFHATATRNYWPIQMRKAHELVWNIRQAPDNFFDHIQTFAASTIMSVAYGYEASSTSDPYVATVEKAMHALNDHITCTRSLIFSLSFPLNVSVLNIPTWAPGGAFRRRAMELKDLKRQMIEIPFQYVQDALTVSSLAVFILAMVRYPEAQRRAQAEIDAVVANDRLPTFEDRPYMPFLEAMLREVLRWHPVAPLGLPRPAREAGSFEGYRIPKGRAMTHDDVRYTDPYDFKPERFLDSDGTLNQDTVSYVFGFGRRICPGRHFADASLWSAIASVLAVFKIEKCDAHFAEPKVDFWRYEVCWLTCDRTRDYRLADTCT